MALLHLVSRVRTCDDCCPSCRALASELLDGLGPELERCTHCGFPKFAGDACPCERHLGLPANPASERFKELAA